MSEAEAETVAMTSHVSDPEIDPCCICLEAIASDAVMLLPCEHILHGRCAASLSSCPLCRAGIASTMAFRVQSWEAMDPSTLPREAEYYSRLSDRELWRVFGDEFRAATRGDDFANGISVSVTGQSVRPSVTVRVPATWNYHTLLYRLCIIFDVRNIAASHLVLSGTWMDSDRLVHEDRAAFAAGKRLQFLRVVYGS
jgi:Ring finger domain